MTKTAAIRSIFAAIISPKCDDSPGCTWTTLEELTTLLGPPSQLGKGEA